jgi:hypothetical protein
MKTIRHTVNVPGEMEPLLNERIRDFRSLSGYFVSLGFTDMLYLPKRPIANDKLPAMRARIDPALHRARK